MNYLEKFLQIQTFIFDVDGVLTNNEILVTEGGEMLRVMNIRDGYAMKQALKNGFRIAIITGGKSMGVVQRLGNLGIRDIFTGIEDKLAVYEDLLEKYELIEEQILYLGDDLPDYHVMRRVGLPVCPADAVPEIKAIAQYISPLKGGEGCVREVIEKVMKLRNCWGQSLEK